MRPSKQNMCMDFTNIECIQRKQMTQVKRRPGCRLDLAQFPTGHSMRRSTAILRLLLPEGPTRVATHVTHRASCQARCRGVASHHARGAGARCWLPLGLRWLKEHLYHVSKIGADLLIDSGYLFAHKRF